MATVVVGGALANKVGNGGEAWVRLSWVRGFEQLGFRTVFVEQIARSGCVDEAGTVTSPGRSVAVRWFRSVTTSFGLWERSALLDDRGSWIAGGMTAAEVVAAAGEAVVLVNISGHLTWAPLLEGTAAAVYVDIDPGFTQHWHADGLLGDALERHHHHVTIGANIGSPSCPIPTGPFVWRHVRQPVVLEDWPVQAPLVPSRLTTIGAWRGAFGPVVVGDRTYGLKVHEFRKLLDLPRRVTPTCEAALAIDDGDAADRAHLAANGWRLRDPQAVAGDPDAFRAYVQGSPAELSPAQGIYVETRSGWFSDRTVRYLASGRPVVVQDTGLADALPVGEGLLTFTDVDGAVAGVEAVCRDHGAHSAAARAIAEDHFDAAVVLPSLLDDLGVEW